MSKYTTEVRFICETESGLAESQGYNSIDKIIGKAISKIFDFNYPIFDENYRKVLETKILKHFYTREICEETVGLWKLRLNTRLNEIMPYYNKLYESELIKIDPLSMYKRKTERTIKDKRKGETGSVTNVTNHNDMWITDDNDSTSKYSDTPQGALKDLLDDAYLTNATVNSNKRTNHSYENGGNDTTNTGKYKDNSLENYLEDITGYSGKTESEMLLVYRDTFLNIDLQVIHELDDLFFNLW